ncbi:DUF2752 domain-containing protein [Streptomyces ginkgonis]|uniref:DUF2752 domain-containing protein n=1 Tax=Streptomyces ginkgonis TaxID=1812259 RepID=UPI002176D5A0|nr:DUF2752 domain-containing protein [Streptomyces ginkgonis]
MPPDAPTVPAARRLRRAAAPLSALATAGAAWAVVAAVDPFAPGSPYPACPLPALTGWDCPGCGGLRAAHALAHGLPGQALAANALVVVAALVLGAALLYWLVAELSGRPVPPPAVSAACRWALAAAVAAFTVLRNLPLFPPGA